MIALINSDIFIMVSECGAENILDSCIFILVSVLFGIFGIYGYGYESNTKIHTYVCYKCICLQFRFDSMDIGVYIYIK